MAPPALLLDNALGFLEKNALQFSTASVPPEYLAPGAATFKPGRAYLKLAQTGTKDVYDLVLVPSSTGSKDKDCISAFVLGALQNRGNDDVAWVDIPRNASNVLKDKTFLFTVGLTGCSVVVTRLNNATQTYRVFHDRRMDSAVLYDNVEMYVNFDDYRIGGQYLSHTGNAITCMQFKEGMWKMYLQRQLPPPPTAPDRLKWEVYAVEQKAGTVTREILEKKFNDRRAVIQNRIKSNAKLLGVDKSLIDGAKDGAYRGSGQYNDEAIHGWNLLRNSIKTKIEERPKKDDRSEEERLIEFGYNLDDSRYVDETWVWLQIKKKVSK